MTGLDKMFVRGIYKDGHETVIRGLPVCCCTETPVINDQSDGMWRRLAECPFEQHFVIYPGPADPKEKLIDGDLAAKLTPHVKGGVTHGHAELGVSVQN